MSETGETQRQGNNTVTLLPRRSWDASPEIPPTRELLIVTHAVCEQPVDPTRFGGSRRGQENGASLRNCAEVLCLLLPLSLLCALLLPGPTPGSPRHTRASSRTRRVLSFNPRLGFQPPVPATPKAPVVRLTTRHLITRDLPPCRSLTPAPARAVTGAHGNHSRLLHQRERGDKLGPRSPRPVSAINSSRGPRQPLALPESLRSLACSEVRVRSSPKRPPLQGAPSPPLHPRLAWTVPLTSTPRPAGIVCHPEPHSPPGGEEGGP